MVSRLNAAWGVRDRVSFWLGWPWGDMDGHSVESYTANDNVIELMGENY